MKILCGFGTDVLICTGTEEIYVFSKRERKITASIRFTCIRQLNRYRSMYFIDPTLGKVTCYNTTRVRKQKS